MTSAPNFEQFAIQTSTQVESSNILSQNFWIEAGWKAEAVRQVFRIGNVHLCQKLKMREVFTFLPMRLFTGGDN